MARVVVLLIADPRRRAFLSLELRHSGQRVHTPESLAEAIELLHPHSVLIAQLNQAERDAVESLFRHKDVEMLFVEEFFNRDTLCELVEKIADARTKLAKEDNAWRN